MSEFAAYVKHGWVLTPIKPGEKRPSGEEWNRRENCVTHPLAAARLSAAGLCHAYSGTCAIDIDNIDVARAWLSERGIDLDELLTSPTAVRIESPSPGHAKLLYALPVPLPSKKLAEFTENGKKRMALELRCGTADGLTAQDVLPPSPHPLGGQYRWAGDGVWTDLPPLPEALHQLWVSLTATTVERKTEPTIDISQIGSLLDGLDPDMARDDWYRVGMAIHHETGGSEAGFKLWHDWSSLGEKYRGEKDCRTVWNSFSLGGGITGQTLVQMRAAAVDPSDFPIVPITQPEPVTNSPIKLWTAGDLLKPHDAPPYLVDGLIEQGAEASLIGPSKSYKSLFALELGVRVATGTPFFGRATTQGLVMYLCGEGAGGLRHRLQALRYARDLDFSHAPFVVLPRPFALPTAEGVQLVRNHIAEAEKQFNCELRLLIIDTFGRFNSGEENVAEDLYKFFRAASACRGSAALLVVHHTGHGDATRGRGTSAWEQAVDTEFVASIKEDTETRVFTNTKQKDGEPAAPMYFRLAKHRTDSTRVGQPVYSVVLEPTVMEAPTVKLGMNEQLVVETVGALSGQDVETIITETVRQIPKPDGRDKRRERVRRAIMSCVAKGVLEIRDEKVYKAGDVLADFDDLIGGG